MPKYTIKKGHESRVFSEQGIRRISETEVESDHELSSPYLDPVQNAPAPAEPAPTPVAPAPTVPLANTAFPVTPTQIVNPESEN